MQTIASRFEYAWDGNLVRGFRVRDKIHRYVAADNGVEVKDGEDTVRIELDPAGHVVKYQRIDSLGLDPTVFTWKGSRLTKLQEIGTTKVEYNCKLPPK